MTQIAKRIVSVLAIWTIATIVSTARSAESLVDLTLEQAIEIALQRHPGLSEAAAELRAAEARRSIAGKPSNPELVARMESAPIRAGTTSQAEYVAGVSQAIPIGKRLAAAKVLGNAEIELNEKRVDAQVLNIRRTVESAFATALYSAEAAEVQTNLASSMGELVRVLNLRVEAGDAAPSDLTRARAEDAQDRLHANEAVKLHEQAIQSLAAALGDHRIHITSLKGSLERELQLERIAMWLTNTSVHPGIAVFESAARVEEARLRLAKAERVPDVNLDLFYRRLQADRQDAFDIGVSVAVPVFGRNSRVREAESNVAAAEARLARAQNEIGQELRSRELALQKDMEAVKVYREDVLIRLDEALATAQARFAAGDISLTDMLALKREAAGARMQYLDALRRVMESWATLKKYQQPY